VTIFIFLGVFYGYYKCPWKIKLRILLGDRNMKLGDIKNLDPKKKTFFATFGRNMGNLTLGLDLSLRELREMSIIRNSVNEEPGDDAQRTLDPNHAQGLALHTLVGLIQTQILKDREVGIDTLRAKNLQKHIGESPYAVLQPMVCNIRDCKKGGEDLEFEWIERLLPNGEKVSLKSIIEVHLAATQPLSVVDGQHRRAGFDIAFDWLQKVCTERKYPLGLIKVIDTNNQGKYIDQEIHEFWQRVSNIAWGESHVKVEVHLGLNVREERQLFADLNNKGKAVDKSLSHSYDRSDSVNVFIEEELIPNIIKCGITVKDSSSWENDCGSILRKDINPITCMVMFGKTSSKKITPAQVADRKGVAIKFWQTVQKIKYFGSEGSRKKTVAAQPVVLQAIARLAFDLAYGRALLKDPKCLESLWLDISNGNLDFTHNNLVWGSLMLSSKDRNSRFKGINKYVHVPFGTNLDAGTHDPETGWVRYGQKRNDIYPRIGDVIRYKLRFAARPSVTKALQS
tara:strand:+ start:732 stop:2264 length:1533 start_codon:yes stop_codon:yes gene_type:complete